MYSGIIDVVFAKQKVIPQPAYSIPLGSAEILACL